MTLFYESEENKCCLGSLPNRLTSLRSMFLSYKIKYTDLYKSNGWFLYEGILVVSGTMSLQSKSSTTKTMVPLLLWQL